MNPDLIFETEHFQVAHCRDCFVPGYLIVSSRSTVKSLGEMAPPMSQELGEVLQRATQAIEAVVKPERTYCARFGEETEALHFHLFPRTRRLLDEYCRSADHEGGPCSGPQVFEWARLEYHRVSSTPLDRECREAIEALRAQCGR